MFRVFIQHGWGLFSIFFLLPVFSSCGGGGGGGDSVVESSDSATGVEEEPVKVSVPASVNFEALSLDNAADSFVISLTDCASGLTGTNSSSSSLNVFLDDTDCIAKLISLVFNSQSYVPSGTGSSPFTTWAVGDNAVFVGADANDLINVKVVSQLSSPIVAADEVTYSFSIIKSSGSTTTVVASSQSIDSAVTGRAAPNFSIGAGDANFIGLVSSGASAGAGLFQFDMTCSSGAMTVGANVSYNSFCPTSVAGGTIANGDSGVDIGVSNNFSYKFIDDVGADGVLTITEAQAAFASGDSTVTLSTDILASDTGFATVTLTGPVTIVSNPNLILVLQSKDPNNPSDPTFSSFQYFPITVQLFNP